MTVVGSDPGPDAPDAPSLEESPRWSGGRAEEVVFPPRERGTTT